MELDLARPCVLQSAALVWREDGKGRRVLLVQKRKSKEWSIPKGRLEAPLSFAENAAKEAWEEAGVKGEVSQNASGSFRATKRGRNGEGIIEVWVYLLRATGQTESWPEKGEREFGWFSCEEAARLLREPLLADLCHRLERGELC